MNESYLVRNSHSPLYDKIPEYRELERVLDKLGSFAKIEKLAEVECAQGQSVPIVGLTMGSQDVNAPVVGLFGGVHGLERIGSQVVLSYLRCLAEYLVWDDYARDLMSKIKLISIPIINPYGFWHSRRSNGNGVDLMRNSPVEGESGHIPKLVGGHRYGPWLPWYRGVAGASMESEAQAVISFVQKHAFGSPYIVTLDCHSGFGYKDRLWFPYAKTKTPFPNLLDMFQFKNLLDDALPHHIYHIEPQSKSYCTHGDLWDYLYEKNRAKNVNSLYLPLTLEMGSWLWVKKNPTQFFSMTGPFNPIVEHRKKRVLRRHLPFLEFIIRSTAGFKNWHKPDQIREQALSRGARELWYS